MKRILIITLALVFGLSAAGLAAGTFSGRWATDFTITTPQTPVIGVSSVLTVDYRLAGWRFGSVSTLTEDGWTRQDFHADGKLGAFALTNHLRFAPTIIYPATTPAFTFLRSIAAVSLAGVDLETRFLVVGPRWVWEEDGRWIWELIDVNGTWVSVWDPDPHWAFVPGGTGLRFRVGGVIDPELLPLVQATAYFGSLAFDPADAWTVIERPHHWFMFQGLDLDVTMRFHSFLLTIDADFTTLDGFQDLTLTVPAFPLGVPGFTLGASVTYTLANKTVALTPTVALVGLGLHFVPFISVVEHGEGGIGALRLDGLRMTWVVDPKVTFIYEWDAPGLPGEIAGPGNAQRIRIDAVMDPITFRSAFAWRHPLPMPMFPEWIDLDLSVALMPGLSLRTGVDIRLPAHTLHALTFGFTVDW